MKSAQTAPASITVTPFVVRSMSGERIEQPAATLPENIWTEVAFTIPDLGGGQAHEIGWRISAEMQDSPWAWGKVFIDSITVCGAADYTIDCACQRTEFGEPTPFSSNDAESSLENGVLTISGDGPCQAFTGNYYAADSFIEADMDSENGACLLLRGQGTRRYYALGFTSADSVAIVRRDGGVRTELAASEYRRSSGRCRMRAEAKGANLSLCIDGAPVLTASDDRFSYGMVGVCHESAGVSRWSDFHIRFDTDTDD